MAAVDITNITKHPLRINAGRMFDHILALGVSEESSQPKPPSAMNPRMKNFFGAGYFGMSLDMITQVPKVPVSPMAWNVPMVSQE
ncbi:hypothetical protein D3C85_1434260 [compost metagenome]